jgi:chloramphenicol O-acetyltransferase type A
VNSVKFNLIHINDWARKPYFEHYSKSVPCTFSITAEIDITLLLSELKRQGLKLYPAFIYMITTLVNRHEQFRTCYDAEGRLGVWDWMSPGFTIFHEENKTFSSIWAPFDAEFSTFYKGCLAQMEAFKHEKTLFPDPSEPPNTFPVSCIPWISFTAFNLNVASEGAYLLPIFTIGKYAARDKRVFLPLSVQLHHAVCDGYHAGLLFQELQALADGCLNWLEIR